MLPRLLLLTYLTKVCCDLPADFCGEVFGDEFFVVGAECFYVGALVDFGIQVELVELEDPGEHFSVVVGR